MFSSNVSDSQSIRNSGKPASNLKVTCLLVSIIAFPLTAVAETQETDAAKSMAEEVSADVPQQHDYPQWSEKYQASREMVPPPPPGPYMSSALSPINNENTYRAPSFSSGKRHHKAYEAVNFPMDTFSPDIPWPTNMRPPSRWIPVDGYNYFEQPVTRAPIMRAPKPAQRPSNNMNQGGFNYGPQSGPVMNWSGKQYGPKTFNQNTHNNSGRRNVRSGPGMVSGRNAPTNRGPSAARNQMQMPSQTPSNRANAYDPNRAPPRHDPRQGQPR